jgi:hypothetical protein
MKAPPCFDDPETKRVVKQICEQHRVDSELLKDLCEMATNILVLVNDSGWMTKLPEY